MIPSFIQYSTLRYTVCSHQKLGSEQLQQNLRLCDHFALFLKIFQLLEEPVVHKH